MAGINIDFIADVSKFIRGTSDIEKSLDDVADALDDVAKDAKKAGDKVGDELSDGADKAADSANDVKKEFKDTFDKVEDGAKDAGREVGDELKDGSKDAGDAGEKMERKFRDAFDETKKGAKTAGDSVGTEIKSGFKKAEGAADEFKDEAKSTAREGAASFSGEFEDVADIVQETLANALSGFGPMGAAAGMAAAAGVGILVSVLQSSADKAAEVKEKVIDLAGAIREAGGDVEDIDWAAQFEDFANVIADPKSWFEPWQAASKTNAEVIAADAERLGLDFTDLFQGMAGDSEAAARSLQVINDRIAAQEAEYEHLVSEGVDPAAAAIATYTGELENQRDKLERATAVTEEATELANLYSEAIEGSAAAVDEFNDAQEKRLGLLKSEAELNMSAAEAQAAWAKQILENAKAHEELEKLIDSTDESTRAATDAVTEGGAALDLYTEAGQYASEALLGTADAGWKMIESAREGGASTDELRTKTQQARDEFIKNATEMGLTGDAANALADQYGLIPSEVSTTAKFNKEEAATALENFTRALGDLNGKTVYTNVVNRISTIETRSTSGAAAAAGMGGYNSGGQVPGAASGVYVTGPGGDIEDRVPYMLSPGEMVLDKQAVDQIGVGNLFAKNEGIGRTGGADIATAVAAGVRDALANLPLMLEVEGQQMSAFIRPVAAGEVRAFEQTRRRVAR